MDESIAQDLKAFERELESLLAKKPGQFALIQGGQVRDAYPSMEVALTVGFDEFGMEPFLVQKIERPPHANVRSDGTLEICRR